VRPPPLKDYFPSLVKRYKNSQLYQCSYLFYTLFEDNFLRDRGLIDAFWLHDWEGGPDIEVLPFQGKNMCETLVMFRISREI